MSRLSLRFGRPWLTSAVLLLCRIPRCCFLFPPPPLSTLLLFPPCVHVLGLGRGQKAFTSLGISGRHDFFFFTFSFPFCTRTPYFHCICFPGEKGIRYLCRLLYSRANQKGRFEKDFIPSDSCFKMYHGSYASGASDLIRVVSLGPFGQRGLDRSHWRPGHAQTS